MGITRGSNGRRHEKTPTALVYLVHIMANIRQICFQTFLLGVVVNAAILYCANITLSRVDLASSTPSLDPSTRIVPIEYWISEDSSVWIGATKHGIVCDHIRIVMGSHAPDKSPARRIHHGTPVLVDLAFAQITDEGRRPYGIRGAVFKFPLAIAAKADVATIAGSLRKPSLSGFNIDPTVLWGRFVLNATLVTFVIAAGLGMAKVCVWQYRCLRNRCPACSYDLRGDPKAGCPECGWNRE